MAGISDLLGANGVIEQLFLWNVVGQVAGTILQPALTLLAQDTNSHNPVNALDPATAADLAARGIITVSAAETEAARSGISTARFADLLALHTVRLAPPDLAEAVVRSYLTMDAAQAQATPQGVTPELLQVMVDLAGDAPGPQQLAQAVRRGIVPRSGSGAESTSFDQGIAEGRLANKWASVLYDLSAAILSPADAASAVVRNFLSLADGQSAAAKNGYDDSTFGTLVQLSADAPGPQQLAEALRRGAIPATGTGPGSTSFQQGIAEGRLADKWAPVIRALSQVWPTPVDALDASVKGVFSQADGQAMYEKLGGDPQFYPWLLWSIGNSPTPLEAATLANRGIIPWDGTGITVLSYQQAVAESRYRDKWAGAYRALSQPVPSASEVVTLYAHGNLSEGQAHDYLLQNGLTAELAAAYTAEADYQAVSGYRGLTESAIISMYTGHIISRDQATDLLKAVHVTESAAGYLLDYADMQYAVAAIKTSVSRLQTLFIAHKISAQTATSSLSKLGVLPAEAEALLADWSIAAAANVKILTESQIADAWYYESMTQAQAIDALGAIGYSPYDAWVLLSVKNKAPLPNPPERVVAVSPGAVIPGVT